MRNLNGCLMNLTIMFLLTSYSIADSPLVGNNEIKVIKTGENEKYGFSKMFEAFTTIFLSGLFDRSFFITAFMAIKYSRCLVLTSASLALSLVGVLSVFLGVAITKFVPALWIDVLAVALFLFFGFKMIAEGLSLPKNQDLIKLQEEHEKLIVKQDGEKPIYYEINNTSTLHHLHGIKEVQKECNVLIDDTTSNAKIFAKIFILIFFSEIGDRSQITTIYLTSNCNKIIVLAASVIAQNVLTIIAIFGGVIISRKISQRNLTIIAGTTFIAFGIFALYFLCVDDIFKLAKNMPDNNMNVGLLNSNEIMPDKKVLISSY